MSRASLFLKRNIRRKPPTISGTSIRIPNTMHDRPYLRLRDNRLILRDTVDGPYQISAVRHPALGRPNYSWLTLAHLDPSWFEPNHQVSSDFEHFSSQNLQIEG